MDKIGDLIIEFIDSIKDDIDALEVLLLSYESSELDKETTKKILRIVHSLKGTSGSYGFRNVSRLCHHFEDEFLQSITEKSIKNDVDQYLTYVDDFKKFIVTHEDIEPLSQVKKSNKNSTSKKSVLVIENSPVYTKIVTNALRKLDVSFTVERDGINAIDLLITKKYDGIILSTSITGLDGLSLLKVIKVIDSNNTNTKVAMMTTRSDLKLEERFKPDLHIIKDSTISAKIENYLINLLDENGNDVDEKKFLFKHVVYIDDSKPLHALVKMGLKKSGCLLNCFIDIKDAVRFIHDNKPDLILCDYNLEEGVTGADVFNMINHYGEKFLFITGESDINGEILKKVPEANGVIYKPISPKSLMKRIVSF